MLALSDTAAALIPHSFCYLQRPDLIWLHVASDATVAIAYFMIPATLVYFIRRNPYKLSFSWALGLFALFIVLCGSGHVLDILTVWTPIYYAQGMLKAATAVVSVMTAVAIIPLVPRLLAMRSPEELALVNGQLQAQARRREEVEADLRRSLAELQRAYADAEQFAYVASHDLQAPLRGIAGFAQLLHRRYRSRLDGEGAEFLGYIERGASQMQGLIRDLLALSRIGRGESCFEEQPLSQCIERARQALISEVTRSQAELQFGALPAVCADHRLLTQLFQNLIGNSIKFQPPGRAPQIRIGAERDGQDWHVVLKDNGIGVPAEHLEAIFNPFRRLHANDDYEGNGIGLALCRKIAHHHGGSIWAAPSERGAEFHLRLPVAPAAALSA